MATAETLAGAACVFTTELGKASGHFLLPQSALLCPQSKAQGPSPVN